LLLEFNTYKLETEGRIEGWHMLRNKTEGTKWTVHGNNGDLGRDRVGSKGLFSSYG